MKIEVTREFRIGGITQKMGKVLEVEKILGIELISANKAVQVFPADKKTPAKTPDKTDTNIASLNGTNASNGGSEVGKWINCNF